jgi:hypothetical protein
MPPQININVLPAQSSQPSISSSLGAEANSSTVQSKIVDIPGLLDQAVEEYTDWHLSRVSAEGFKENTKKRVIYHWTTVSTSSKSVVKPQTSLSGRG